MKFMALERELPDATAEGFAQHAKAEARRAWELYQQGIIREMYFNADEHTAVIILEAQDKETAKQYLDSLPMVQASLIDFDLIPLVPYDGFARLFND